MPSVRTPGPGQRSTCEDRPRLRRIRAARRPRHQRAVTVVDEPDIVGRAHHVEVQVRVDLRPLRIGEVVHVVLRAKQTRLFGAPESETHLPLQLVVYFNAASCSAISRIVAEPLPLSLIPWSCSHRVEVRTDNDGLASPLILPIGRVGDDVDGLSIEISLGGRRRRVRSPRRLGPRDTGLRRRRSWPDRPEWSSDCRECLSAARYDRAWPSLKMITAS